jgi:hypothetical protein
LCFWEGKYRKESAMNEVDRVINQGQSAMDAISTRLFPEAKGAKKEARKKRREKRGAKRGARREKNSS